MICQVRLGKQVTVNENDVGKKRLETIRNCKCRKTNNRILRPVRTKARAELPLHGVYEEQEIWERTVMGPVRCWVVTKLQLDKSHLW
jgi:hypothetical protein